MWASPKLSKKTEQGGGIFSLIRVGTKSETNKTVDNLGIFVHSAGYTIICLKV